MVRVGFGVGGVLFGPNQIGRRSPVDHIPALCVVESSSGALNLVQCFTNLVEAGERNGLDDDNWRTLFLMMSEKHLKEAHSSISRFTDDLDGLIGEILNQINSEAEICKLRNALMKTNRSTTESVATVLGRIKSI